MGDTTAELPKIDCELWSEPDPWGCVRYVQGKDIGQLAGELRAILTDAEREAIDEVYDFGYLFPHGRFPHGGRFFVSVDWNANDGVPLVSLRYLYSRYPHPGTEGRLGQCRTVLGCRVEGDDEAAFSIARKWTKALLWF